MRTDDRNKTSTSNCPIVPIAGDWLVGGEVAATLEEIGYAVILDVAGTGRPDPGGAGGHCHYELREGPERISGALSRAASWAAASFARVEEQ